MSELKQTILTYYLFSENGIKLPYVPNRVSILRDFDNLIRDKYCYVDDKKFSNNITISDDKLFSKLQKSIFKKINNICDQSSLKTLLVNDISLKNYPENIYEVANLWCNKKYYNNICL